MYAGVFEYDDVQGCQYCMAFLVQGRILNLIMKLGQAGENRGPVSIGNLYIISLK